MNALLLLALSTTPNVAPTADLVVVNARIGTGNTKQPDATGLAVWKGRLLVVGSDAEAKALAGPLTNVIDLGGKRVVPGFYDSHAHVLGGGLQLARVELKDAKDEAEFGRRLVEFDRKTPKDRWLLGGNWDHDRTFNGVLPTAEMIDKYVKDRPVFIRRSQWFGRKASGRREEGRWRRDEPSVRRPADLPRTASRRHSERLPSSRAPHR